MTPLLAPRAARDFLLVPTMPTPNGGLHLGHMAGPYLKMDVLRRHLRRRGDRVLVVSGSDAHDSFVLLRAHALGRPPEEVASHFHRRILAELEALDVRFDAFINPLEERWVGPYTRWWRSVFERWSAQSAVETRTERYLYSPRTDRYIIGCWLLGTCPECGAGAGSYFCEGCGAFFRPEQIGAPRSRMNEDDLEWREVACLYLRLSAERRLFEQLDRMGVPEAFQRIARRYTRQHGPAVVMTQPGSWGVPWRVPGSPVPQVAFNYVGLLCYSLLCGDVWAEVTGSGLNAFDPRSAVTVVGSFGIDNTVPFLVAAVGGALEHGAVKPFDHFLTNYFYFLNDGKFSTSRDHVIWPSEIVGGTPATSDGVRLYIALTNPESAESRFDVDDFVRFSATLLAALDRSVREAWRRLGGAARTEPPEGLVERLRAALEDQDAALDPARFDLRRAAGGVAAWSAAGAAQRPEEDPYWWLKGLALLAWPFMPRLAAALWNGLGQPGEPAVEGLLDRGEVASGAPPGFFPPVERGLLDRCLPPALRSAGPAPP